MSTNRQLAAILFTDIVGYSAIMQQDEHGAIRLVKHHRVVLKNAVAEHEGDVIDYYGDGSLCIFTSITQAMQCAYSIQKQLREDPVVPLRIGLHIGEVVFEDGKIMMASMESLNNTGWTKVKEIIGLEKIRQLFQESNLICMVNWSEIDASTDIWKGILAEIITPYSTGKKQTAFFDLSDFSKRSQAAVQEALDIIKAFSSYCNVTLSLNRNEALLLYKILCNANTTDLTAAGKNIFERLQPATLLIHSSKEVIAFTKDALYKSASFFTAKPVISTGAGDNFNAGFCAAHLLKLNTELSVMMANAVSGCYIRTSTSPSINDVIDFLENYLSE